MNRFVNRIVDLPADGFAINLEETQTVIRSELMHARTLKANDYILYIDI